MYEITDRADYFPAKCLVSGDIHGPFIDIGPIGDGLHGYLHVSVGEQVGRALEMVPKAEVDALRTQTAELATKYAALDAYREAVEQVAVAEKELV